MKKITVAGKHFSNLKGFYDEVEAKLTKGLDWKIGRNLNAYNDVLRGGFGIHRYGEKITIRWTDSEKSREDLGPVETLSHWKKALKTCDPSNIPYLKKDIEKLKRGKGKTLFDEIVEITLSHEHVTLKLE